MVCSTSLILALGLMGASVATSLSSRSLALKSDFCKTLNDEQRKAYLEIIDERMSLYTQGLAVGLIAGALYIAMLPVNKREPTPSVIGSFALIVLGVQFLYYMLSPKTKWMLNIVKTEEQTRKWLEIYRYMSLRWYSGMAMGLAGALVGCYGCLRK
jgi:hypothetical protein